MKLFFDLDGTLLDSHFRLYSLFQFLVPLSKLSFEEYWNYKRNKVNHKAILTNYFSYTDYEFNTFNDAWFKLIETSEYLKYDRLFPGVNTFLEKCQNGNELFLLTARQSEERVLQQLKTFDIYKYFKDILVTGAKLEKVSLVRNRVKYSHDDWMIGDTGKDIETGKHLGMNTAAVLSGFLNRESLEGYKPTIIVENVVKLKFI